jgi:ectoine hydroxylase-related dioxygenase (phytanoyl-CoA dioxygenase family)
MIDNHIQVIMTDSLSQPSMAEFDDQMATRGWFLFEDVVDQELIRELTIDLEQAYEIRREIQIRNGVDADTQGTAHHLLADGKSFVELLKRAYLDQYLKSFFQGNYILNTYGGNLNQKHNFTYASVVHRDVRTYTREIKFLMNIIVMLDDFTLDNGATYLLSGSHLKPEKPSDEEFFARADRATGRSGSIVVWDSNIWHAAGINRTDQPRRSLSLIYSKPFMKQQFDYPRTVGYDGADSYSEEFRQIVGFNARVPASLDEWYQPPEKRFYKKDQG